MGYRAAGTNLASKLKTKRTARIGVALLVFGMLALITQAQFEPIDARVVRVIDGDTIRVQVQGKEYTVRLIGVDTPETVYPTKTVQHFGAEASASTKTAIPGRARTASGGMTCWFSPRLPTSHTRGSCIFPRDRTAIAKAPRPDGRARERRGGARFETPRFDTVRRVGGDTPQLRVASTH